MENKKVEVHIEGKVLRLLQIKCHRALLDKYGTYKYLLLYITGACIHTWTAYVHIHAETNIQKHIEGEEHGGGGEFFYGQRVACDGIRIFVDAIICEYALLKMHHLYLFWVHKGC